MPDGSPYIDAENASFKSHAHNELSPLHAAALAYAAQGFHVFPCLPGTKKPIYEGAFHNASTDPKQITDWWSRNPDANIGWSPAYGGMTVVDLDCKPGQPNGFAALEALQVEHSDVLPATRTLTTPTGGEHRIYRGAMRSSVGKNGGIAPGIDIRGGIIIDGAVESGGYGLLPPSSLADGTAYSWKAEIAPVALPVWFSALNTKAKIEPRKAPPEGVELDLPYSLEEGRKWLARQQQAGEGFASDLFYRQATKLQDFALSNEMCVELLHEKNPSYTYEDIGQRVANAEKHRQNAIGCDRPISDEEMFAAVVPPPPSIIKPHKNHFRTRAQSKDEPPPVYLIEGLLQEDSDAALIAPSGHLKSFVALDLAFAVATGKDALGQFKVKRGPVLYFAGEGARSLKKKRATAWEIAHGFEAYGVEDVFIADIVPIVNRPDLIAELIADAKEMLGGRAPALVINDTLNRSLNGEDEDSSATAARYLNTIAAIRRELGGGATLTVHHSGYSDAGRGRGSSAFGAGWDTEINIETHTENELTSQHEIAVVVKKQKDDDGGQRIYLRSRSVDIPDGASLVLEPIPALERGPALARLNETEQRTAIFRVFCARQAHSLDTGLKTTELAEALGGERRPGESANDFATRQKQWYEILQAGTKPPKNRSRGARFADLFEDDQRPEVGRSLFGKPVRRWYATVEQCQEFLAAAAVFQEPEVW